MAEPRAGQVWIMRAAYLALAMAILFAHLLPLNLMPARIAPPDLLIAVTFAWALRRPDFVPAWLVAAVFLLADLLMQRPPGLWAAFALMASEFLKGTDRRLRDSTFFEEWLTMAILLGIITVIYRLALALLIVSPGAYTLAVIQFGLTIAVYPPVVAVSHFVFGVRRAAPGEYDPLGRAP